MKEKNYRENTPPPKHYQDFKSKYPAVVEAYEELGKACHWNGPLDPRTRELIKMGISMGANLESATRAHARLALDAGASEEELEHAVLLATTTLGFPGMTRSMSWVKDVLKRDKA